MLDTVRILYEYTLKNRVPGFLTGAEYEEVCQVAKGREEELYRLLPQERQQSLEDYSRELELKETIELEAMFQAALSVGMELSRL